MIELNMAKFNVKNPTTGQFEPLDGATQARIQSDWNQTNNAAEDYIKNKPVIGAAATKDIDTEPLPDSENLITSGAVYNAIDQIPKPMVFKGTVGTNGTTTGTIATLPTNGSANIGDTYKVLFDGTYASIAAKEGDTFICLTKTSNSNTWEIIPSDDETGSGSGTVTAVQAGAGLHVDSQTSGGTISSSGTLNLNLKSTTQSSLTATTKGATSGREYAVGLDTNGKLSVNIPWTDTINYNNLINTPTLGTAAALNMDSSLNSTSTNPVQNKAIYTELQSYVSKNGSNILNNLFEPESNESAELGSSSYQFKHIYANEGHLQSIYLANETTPTITYDAQRHRITIPTDIVSNTVTGTGTVALLNAVMHPENGEAYKEESIIGTDSIRFQYKKGTTSERGYAGFALGNSIIEGSEWNTSGGIAFYNKNGNYTEIQANENSIDNYGVILPNKSGTLACLSDLHSYTAGSGLSLSNNEFSLSTPVSVPNGGTGATSASAARTNLGLGTAATKDSTTSVTSGGTGLTTSGAVYTHSTLLTEIPITAATGFSIIDNISNYSEAGKLVTINATIALTAALSAGTSTKTIATFSSYKPKNIVIAACAENGSYETLCCYITTAGNIQIAGYPDIASGKYIRVSVSYRIT